MTRASFLLVLTLAACTNAPSLPLPARRQFIVALDLSGSRTPEQQRESRRALDAVVEQVRAGDALALLEVQDGRARRQWYDSAAAPRGAAVDARKEGEFRELARTVVAAMFGGGEARAASETNLLATLFDVAELAHGSAGRAPVLVLLSDAVNESGDVDMAKRGIPSAAWVTERAARGMLPDLKGVCVNVVGVEVGTPRGVALRTFWREYFERAGARTGEWANTLVDPGLLACPSTQV